MCTTLHDIFQESQVVDTENEKSETREKNMTILEKIQIIGNCVDML